MTLLLLSEQGSVRASYSGRALGALATALLVGKDGKINALILRPICSWGPE